MQPKKGIYAQNNNPTRRFEAGGGKPRSNRPFQRRRFGFAEGGIRCAQEFKVPVIIGVSEGEREFIGVRQIAGLVRSLREEFDFPIFLNADHTHSLSKAIDAAEAGFDSIVFDLSALPFDENVRQTKEGVETLKKINPGILIEGEIGDIGTGSEIHETALEVSGV